MQAPTHLLTGVLLQRLLRSHDFVWPANMLIAVSGFLSHGLLDKLAISTYQPSEAAISDGFWLGFHIITFLTSVVVIYVYGAEFKWGMSMALLPDIDWIFVHGQNLTGLETGFYHTPFIHESLNTLFDNIPGIYLFNFLPDWRQVYAACIPEILLCLLIIAFIRLHQNRRRNIHF